MFIEQFTEMARAGIIKARVFTLDVKSPALDNIHLLHGVLRLDDLDTSKDTGARRYLKEEICLDMNVFKAVLLKIIKGGYTPLRSSDRNRDIPFTSGAKTSLEHAIEFANKHSYHHVNTILVLLGIVSLNEKHVTSLLEQMNLTPETIIENANIDGFDDLVEHTRAEQKIVTKALDTFGIDLTKMSKEQKLDPVLCREKETERLIHILSRRTKNNPILVGDPGVGKTAIVEGLAQRIVNKNIPQELSSFRIISLDLGMIIAGTKYRGQFEERMKAILKDISKDKNVIVFIDEIHTLVGAGSAEGSLDAANLIKASLARGELHCIGATTLKEYRKYFERDGALERRFQRINVGPPSVEDSIEILKGLKYKYEEFHHVTFEEAILKDIVTLSDRYISDRHLPDKAIDVLDEVASSVRLKQKNIVKHTEEDKKAVEQISKLQEELSRMGRNGIGVSDIDKAIAMHNTLRELRLMQKGNPLRTTHDELKITRGDVTHVITNWTGIPIDTLDKNEDADAMKTWFAKRVVGQDEAIDTICRAMNRNKAGLSNINRPTGSFMFLGPSGVGKTEVCRCLAEFLFGKRTSLIQLDMSEYSERHSVSRLIGSPPGYVGYDEGGQLTEPVRKNPYNIILVDEIEKAHPAVINVFLQVFEDGHLTDGNGHNVNFKHTVIIMTSNVGISHIRSTKKMPTGEEVVLSTKGTKAIMLENLKRFFPIEFLNRIDKTVVFNTLSKENVRDIIKIQIRDLNDNLLNPKRLTLVLKQEAETWLVKNGFSDEYGARYLNRCITENITDVISESLISGQLEEGNDLTVGCSGKDLCIEVKDCVTA